jgi:hypothetical protein
MVMTLKLNNDYHTGKHLQHYGQNKCAKVDTRQKVMLTTFFDGEGIVYYDYAAQGKTENNHFYLGGVRCLCDAVCCK